MPPNCETVYTTCYEVVRTAGLWARLHYRLQNSLTYQVAEAVAIPGHEAVVPLRCGTFWGAGPRGHLRRQTRTVCAFELQSRLRRWVVKLSAPLGCGIV